MSTRLSLALLLTFLGQSGHATENQIKTSSSEQQQESSGYHVKKTSFSTTNPDRGNFLDKRETKETKIEPNVPIEKFVMTDYWQISRTGRRRTIRRTVTAESSSGSSMVRRRSDKIHRPVDSDIMPPIQPSTDLNRIFDDGYSLTYDMPNYGRQQVTISTHRIGELVLTSGILLPCDLLIVPDSRYCLERTIAPGRYSVILSVAKFTPTGNTRVAAAKLQITKGVPVRWEPALVKQKNPDGSERFSYGVDSGTGSFMDVDVARRLSPLVWKDSGKTNEFEQFCDRVIAEMDKNSLGRHQTASWANMIVDQESGANVITFSAGWGDGGYASFWGLDKSGDVACLVTDFALF